MVDRVTVLDDEDVFTYSSDSDEGRSRMRPVRRPSIKVNREPLRVDGRVPDIIHSQEYYGWRNKVVALRQSVTPLQDVPDVKTLIKTDGKVPEQDKAVMERPVLEIRTKIYTSRDPGSPRYPPPPRRHHGYRVTHRPITAVFGDTAYSSEGSSDDDSREPDRQGTVDVEQPQMFIYSAPLEHAINAVVFYYPRFNKSGDSLVVDAPYKVLYHHREDLREYRDNQPRWHSPEYAALTAKHIDILLSFLATALDGEVEKEEELHRLETPMATHKYFWLLLKPGNVFYAKRYDIWTPFVVSSVDAGPPQRHASTYNVHGWLLESNGTKVERFMAVFTASPWLGEQAISTLPIIPAAFWKEDVDAQGGLTMREKCIKEGRFYWNLLYAPKYMEYDGYLVSSSRRSVRADGPTGFMSGRVIADISGFDKYHAMAPERSNSDRRGVLPPLPPGPRRRRDHLPKTMPRCSCGDCAEHREPAKQSPYVGFESLDPMMDCPPGSELFYMLLSNTVPGLILGSRRWGHLAIANLRPVVTDKEAFKSLMIDEEIKLTVKALIGQYATDMAHGLVKPWGKDFVKNKGEGRIFLFHGEPGVGKTCTAECIAELTGRPLLALTAGDLSVESWRVEENLEYFLELGQRYGALVLLDEADVYLERRRSSDIDRNGLVSIFLRALEYYSGCIVISTNRVRSFDEAFMSRIHVALHYRNLSDDDRERIWSNNFERLDRESDGMVRFTFAARKYLWSSPEVRALRWNGREIRNAMQTALALAERDMEDDEKILIGEKHVKAVVRMSKGFRDFMRGDDGDEADDENGGAREESDGEQSEASQFNPFD